MANRNMQAKLRKLRRKYRFARFSGEATKYAVRLEQRLEHKGEDKVHVKTFEIPVGPIHLSKQVPSGKGPNPERMQEYYGRVRKESFFEEVKLRSTGEMKTWLAQYEELLKETPKERRLLVAETRDARVDIFFSNSGCYIVEINYRLESFRRSRTYGDKKTAIDRLRNDRVSWIEQLSKK